jgi:hypothetical protein
MEGRILEESVQEFGTRQTWLLVTHKEVEMLKKKSYSSAFILSLMHVASNHPFYQ